MKTSMVALNALIAALAFSCGSSSAAPPISEQVAEGYREPPFKIVVLAPAKPSPDTAAAISEVVESELSAGLSPGMLTIVRYAGRLSGGNAAWERSLELLGQEQYKAVVALCAPLGAVGLFEALRARRPDVLLVSLAYPDDPLAMQAAADLAITVKHEAKSAALVQLSENFKATGIVQLGMKSAQPSWEAEQRAVSLSKLASERALAYELIELNQSDLRKDPALITAELVAARLARADGGAVAAAEQRWVFTSDLPELAERLLYAALDKGAFYIESAAPQFGLRYGGAENLDDLPRAFDSVALSRNAAGRAAFWPGEQPENLGRAVLAHVAASVGKPALLRDPEALARALRKAWPASAWLVEPYRDQDSKVRAKNHLTLASYPYVAGRGYIKFY
ncbi:MAG TPA: hypothetical protein DCG47_00720 [Spirochaetaceae bacterium]|nr:hypothetical protein [Spirochaetaceae bacterium]